jgi:DNA-binding MarR family transcriptional regulator
LNSAPLTAPLTTARSHHRPRLADPQGMRDVLPYQANRLLALTGAPVVRWCEGQFGVSRRLWRLLAALAEQGAMRSSELAQHAELDRVRTSRALLELENRGLIQRRPEPDNAKHVCVSITPAGREIYEGIWPLVRAHHQRLMSVLNATEIAKLEEMIDRLQDQALHLHTVYEDLPKANRRAGQAARHGNSIRMTP